MSALTGTLKQLSQTFSDCDLWWYLFGAQALYILDTLRLLEEALGGSQSITTTIVKKLTSPLCVFT